MGDFLESLGLGPVDEWVGVALRDGAHVDISLDLEVALVSPGCSPGVLDVPELLSGLLSVAGGQDSVVDLLGSLAAVVDAVDSALVVLEAGDDLEGHRNGSGDIQPLSEFLLVPEGNVVAAVLAVADGQTGSEHAGSVLGGVGVGRGRGQSVVLDVLERVGGEASAAAVVVVVLGAVHQLLLSEDDVLALAEDVPEGLHGAHGRESPAGPAGALVLDGGHHSEAVPLEGGGHAGLLELLADLEVVGGRTVLGSHQSDARELLERQVGVVVDALGPGRLLHVVASDLLQGCPEDLEPRLALLGVHRAELRVDLAG